MIDLIKEMKINLFLKIQDLIIIKKGLKKSFFPKVKITILTHQKAKKVLSLKEKKALDLKEKKALDLKEKKALEKEVTGSNLIHNFLIDIPNFPFLNS